MIQTRTVTFTCEHIDIALIVSDLLELPMNNLTAVLARVRNFVRLGLFSGKQMSKGRATHYDAREALELCLATVMGYAGIGPADATRIIHSSREEIHSLAKMGAPFSLKRPLTILSWDVGRIRAAIVRREVSILSRGSGDKL